MPIILGFALLVLLAAVLVPQLWIRRVFARHGAERPDLPGTGAELARHLLDRVGLADVKALRLFAEQVVPDVAEA